MAGIKSVDVILQKNCLETHPDNKLLQVFDLKGSLFRRKILDPKFLD